VVLPTIKAKQDALPPVTAIAYHPDKKTLWIARNNRLAIAKQSGEEFVVKETRHGSDITALLDGVFRGQDDAKGGAVFMYDDPAALGYHEASVLCLASSMKVLASSSYDSRINLYTHSDRDGIVVRTLKEHSDAVYGLAFNPDGKQLASVSADRAMKVFDVEKAKLLYTLGEATDWLYAVAWSPDGKYLVSGGVDKSIRVYEPTPAGAKIRQSVFAHEGAVLKLVFSSDSKTLYSVGEDRVVKAWDVEKMVERKVYDRQPETVLCLALREDAGQIIVGRYDGIVQLIDMKTGKIAHEFGKEKQPPAKPRDERSDSRGSNPQPSLILFNGPDKKAVPSPITGKLDRAGAVQFHRIDVKAGQSLGVRIQAAALKSKLDPVLILADATGHTLAEGMQGHLGYTFAKAGTYAIGVRDRDYRGGSDFTYRLQFGEIPIVTEVFPLSLPRGARGARSMSMGYSSRGA
jgi:WD40 repeat protein